MVTLANKTSTLMVFRDVSFVPHKIAHTVTNRWYLYEFRKQVDVQTPADFYTRQNCDDYDQGIRFTWVGGQKTSNDKGVEVKVHIQSRNSLSKNSRNFGVKKSKKNLGIYTSCSCSDNFFRIHIRFLKKI
ncbi:hypothetical protein TcasGA2_TC005346 [Tribolium castaneum]|uniref:Uncharacterized protein n=1 Tax=Tribolium castaneum TaxID=7070 RepID=D6WUV5_TRICA|nr:hypothetical protein TcasGA2_TC005346 [Tribolium castaneum]